MRSRFRGEADVVVIGALEVGYNHGFETVDCFGNALSVEIDVVGELCVAESAIAAAAEWQNLALLI